MNLPELYKRAIKLTVDNGPAVLTTVAVVGTVATAYLTGKATFKAAEIIGDEAEKRLLHEREENRKFPNVDKVKLIWPQYLPAAGMAVTTIGCIIFANRISAKRLAAVGVAYSLSEKRFAEYKDKITEKMGLAKEQAARDEMAQERVSKIPPGTPVIMGGGDVLMMDEISGRLFMNDVETVRKAVNDINAKMMVHGEATLSDFYDLLGLPPTKHSDELGWTVENRLEIGFSTTIADHNRPCMVLEYRTGPGPIRNYSFR